MEDRMIVDLYWRRDETAILETDAKYSRYLIKIARHVVSDSSDCNEIINDTYLKAWHSMPVHKPSVLSTYLGKITRQLAIDVYRKYNALKRGYSEYSLSLTELEDCIPGGSSPEETVDLKQLSAAITAYLHSLPDENRQVFVCRYFFLDSIREIADCRHTSPSRIKSMLHRTRLGLKKHLEKEGYIL